MFAVTGGPSSALAGLVPLVAVLFVALAAVICVVSIPSVRHTLVERIASNFGEEDPLAADDDEENVSVEDLERSRFDMSFFDESPEDT